MSEFVFSVEKGSPFIFNEGTCVSCNQRPKRVVRLDSIVRIEIQEGGLVTDGPARKVRVGICQDCANKLFEGEGER